MDITIKGYQRNGISGNGFYTALGTSNSLTEPMPLIITFETDNDENGNNEHVVYESCRVVSPFHLQQSWRGDRFAYSIQRACVAVMETDSKTSFYDLVGMTIDIGEI